MTSRRCIGLGLAVAAAGLSAGCAAQSQPSTPATNLSLISCNDCTYATATGTLKFPPGEIGRFQPFFAPSTGILIVDTTTGQIYRRKFDKWEPDGLPVTRPGDPKTPQFDRSDSK